MLFDLHTKKISPSSYNEFLDLLSDYQLPDGDIGKKLVHNSSMKLIKITDGDRELLLTLLRTEGDVVDFSNPKEVKNTPAVIFSKEEDKSWYVKETDDFKYIPTLRQAFNESPDYREREADYKYHFDDGDVFIAVPSSNPVSRLDEPVHISAVEFLGGEFPKQWVLESREGDALYLRERAGNIKLYNGVDISDDIIFSAFVGREHPGTNLFPEEVISIISAVDYINLEDGYKDEVSEETMEEYNKELIDMYDKYDTNKPFDI